LFTLLGLSIVVFSLLRLSGDPVNLLVPVNATPAEIETTRKIYGLDRPLPEQYWSFVTKAVQGDFGKSIRSGQSVLPLVLERLPATGVLALASLALALLMAFPVGIFAALYRNTWVDRLLMGFALLGQSMPVFWLGILLMLIFAVNLQVLPATGTREGWRSLVLPGITLGMLFMARTARLLRSEMLEVLGADYILTARGKGLSEHLVVWRHALRNALLPVVTLIGLDMGSLLAGSVITETIFAWPGMGRLAVNAIYGRDYPVVQATVFVVAITYLLINLLVDLLYVTLNPRVRLS
jgi:ABC-type dipeptide/oligopeptide/nickel transport system permease component